MGTHDRVVTLESIVERALLTGDFSKSAPSWPGDIFGLAGLILQRLGGSHRVMDIPWPPHQNWTTNVESAAEAWFKNLLAFGWDDWDEESSQKSGEALTIQLPRLVTSSWRVVAAHWRTDVRVLNYNSTRDPEDSQKQTKLLDALITLLAISDSTMGRILKACTTKTSFTLFIRDRMKTQGTLAMSLNPDEVRVLPKIMTPNVGLSMRSLSYHVTVWTEADVEPIVHPFGYTWMARLTSRKSRGSSLYALLVPWPYSISDSQFQPLPSSTKQIQLAEGYGFFTYKGKNDAGELAGKIGRLITESQRLVGRVDTIILPEASMTVHDYTQIERYLASRVPLSIIGVHGEGVNQVHISQSLPPGEGANGTDMNASSIFATQVKHHRWKIDRNQLLQYQIGSQLDLDIEWWESHSITKRQLNLIGLDPEFMITTLVCEDLARQDPVSRLVRAIGPNLVVAVLMDGPQVKGRWSDRYATVLADDPGSSVLTLTSKGMVDRAHPPKGHTRSNSIGLWRDSVEGARELSLESGVEGLLLRLELTEIQQNTADRREPIRRLIPVLREVFEVR